jgi:hypothetical protein
VTDDPVEAALRRLAADLPPGHRPRFLELMRAGLAGFDPVVGPEDKVVEIEAATAVPPDRRLAAAERFASQRRAFTLGRRSWDLLRAFAAGHDVADEAERLLGDIRAAIRDERDADVRRELGDYATECRYVLSGGTGPNSLRGAKLA